jgi:hypothetical protein
MSISRRCECTRIPECFDAKTRDDGRRGFDRNEAPRFRNSNKQIKQIVLTYEFEVLTVIALTCIIILLTLPMHA